MNPKKTILNESSSRFFSLRKKEQDNFKIGYQTTYAILLGIISCLLVYYVWTLNANATQGYSIREMEQTQKELKDELNRLESKISEYQSINTIENSEVSNDMQKPDEISYIILKDSSQYAYFK